MANTRNNLAALAISCFTVAGCASSEGSFQGAKGTLEVTRDLSYYTGREINLPLDSYVLTRSQRGDFEEAVYEIASECMRSFGLKWPRPTQEKSLAAENSRRYGVIDLRQAEKFGYRVPLPNGMDSEEASRIARDNTERTRRLPQEVRNVYTGEGVDVLKGRVVPRGGCRGSAYAKLGLPPEGFDSTTIDIMRYGAWDRARNSRIVIDAVTRWSTCMNKAGYQYKTLEEAVGDSAWQREKDPSEREIATAIADIGCKSEVMLAEKWHAVEVENQKALLRDKANILKGSKRKIEILMNNISRIHSGV
ncbi:hypothetical protein ACFFSH_38590 [Streptomyces filamentosus]|uniref:Lipoprotein n=1 Tax=Streptomyces filamentosus TaxID=67294 RepID=A0A919BPC9_STRFL|nr:hypothetical protein [Streptomyces filamentosus]GHG05394.1 hypothetical protein GCM10017667_40270 [Streptomyces filamentosus]